MPYIHDDRVESHADIESFVDIETYSFHPHSNTSTLESNKKSASEKAMHIKMCSVAIEPAESIIPPVSVSFVRR